MSEMNQNNNGPVKGAIHSIESFGSVDGPGVRYVIFVKGCDCLLYTSPSPRD